MVHYDVVSDVMALQVNTCENTFVQATQKQFNLDILELLTITAREHPAHLASTCHNTLKGLDPDIDPDCAPKNFKYAMSRKNRQEWAEALNKEYWAVIQGPKRARYCQAAQRNKDLGDIIIMLVY